MPAVESAHEHKADQATGADGGPRLGLSAEVEAEEEGEAQAHGRKEEREEDRALIKRKSPNRHGKSCRSGEWPRAGQQFQ